MRVAPVALVLVSHSAKVAEGAAEIAAQMAPDVLIRPAGGVDGRIGTSFDRVANATEELLHTAGIEGVALLTDLGSATMTAEAVLEALDDPRAALAPGPLVEGAVAAAVAAQTGGDVAAVRGAVADACPPSTRTTEAGVRAPAVPDSRGSQDAVFTRTVCLCNRLGLHTRPAALLARTAAAFHAVVTLDGVPATSVLGLVALDRAAGDQIHLTASGPEAAQALDAIERLVDSGFGEDVAGS